MAVSVPTGVDDEYAAKRPTAANIDDVIYDDNVGFLLDLTGSVEYDDQYNENREDQSAVFTTSKSANGHSRRFSSVGRNTIVTGNNTASVGDALVHYFRSATTHNNGSWVDAIGGGTGTGTSKVESLWSVLNSSTAVLEDGVALDIDVWTPGVVFRVSMIFVLIAVTLVGNALLIAVIVGQPSLRRKRVSVFLVNLAVGDLMVCFVTMTTEILFVAFGEWVLGAVACKLIVYGQIVTLASTTFLLTAMSIDRYQVIVQPLGSGGNVWRKLVPCWLLALLFALPQLFIFVQVQENVEISPMTGSQTTDGADNNVNEIPLLSGVPGYPGEYSDETMTSTMTSMPGIRQVFACKSHGYTEEWQRKVYLTFMTLYILVIPTIIMSVCYTGIIRVVWLRVVSSTTEDWTVGSGIVGTSAACGGGCGDRPKIHFVSSKKSPLVIQMAGVAAAMTTDRHNAASQPPHYDFTGSHRCLGAVDRLQRQAQAGSIQNASTTSAMMRTTATARLQTAILSKRNVVKMTMSVIVGFVVCWTPYFVVSLVRVYTDYSVRMDDALSVSELMTMGHSALNPLIYMLFSRRALATYLSLLKRRLFHCCSEFTSPSSPSRCLRCYGKRQPYSGGRRAAGGRPFALAAAEVKIVDAIEDEAVDFEGDQVNNRLSVVAAAAAIADLPAGRLSTQPRALRRGDPGIPKLVRSVREGHSRRPSGGRAPDDVPSHNGNTDGGGYSITALKAGAEHLTTASTTTRRIITTSGSVVAGRRGVSAERAMEPSSTASSRSGCSRRRPYSAPCFHGSVSPSSASTAPGAKASANFDGASTSAVCDFGLKSATSVGGYSVSSNRWHTLLQSSSVSNHGRRRATSSASHAAITSSTHHMNAVACRYS